MKKKIFIPILLVAITLVVSISVVAIYNMNAPADDSDVGMVYDDVEYSPVSAVSYASPEDFSTRLTYQKTGSSLSDSYKVYTDGVNEGLEYYFNEKDRFVGINASVIDDSDYAKAIIKGLAAGITEKEAHGIALKTASALFGDDIKGFTDIETEKNGNTGSYTVTYKKVYGKDGFVEGPSCRVKIDADGFVSSCIMNGADYYYEFDEKLLDTVTLADVTEFVESSTAARCDEYTSVSFDSVYLHRQNGKLVLRINAEITAPEIPEGDDVERYLSLPEPGEDQEFIIIFYYQLENTDVAA